MLANDALEFLQCVLPAEGYYCAVIFDSPNPRPGIDFPRQQFCSTVEQLSELLLYHDAQGRTVYHACASFKTPTRRSHDNARAARSFWLDVDAGEGKAHHDAQEAAEAVILFCRVAGLPSPIFVGSGSGIHCYWPLDVDLDAQTWTRYAVGLKSLCAEKGLKADPARTGDISSILRPPGTHHRKNGERLVSCGPRVTPISLGYFSRHAEINTVLPTVRRERDHSVVSRITSTTSYTAAYADPIADACGQLRAFKLSGNLREPHWYAVLGVLSRCEDGEIKAHEWSAHDYPAYSQIETQHKFERAKGLTGATTCAKLNDVNLGICELCPHWQKINSPIVLGEAKAVALEQPPEIDPEYAGVIPTLPVLPTPFQWSGKGQLCVYSENAKGERETFIVTENPIYLDSVQIGELDSTSFSYRFKKFLPKSGWSDVVINAGTLHGQSGIAEMFDKGVVIHEPKPFLTYVRHAVDQYHEENQTETRYDQFGWKNDNSSFLFGKMLYTRAGPVEAIGAEEVSTRSQWLGPKRGGNLASWTEAADSLFASDMEGISTIVLASFAAPLMRFLAADEGGAILHAFTTSSGTGKTTALTGAWTVWSGAKEGLNLTNEDTKVSKPIALGTLGNLPVIYDELRDKDPEVIRRMVIMFTEGRDRMRGTVRGTIRHTKANWQTVLLSAANTSLIDQLQSDGPDAPAYRVLEIGTTLPRDIDKAKGDRLKRMLTENAGHAGDAYLRYLLQPAVLTWTKQALEQWTQEIWRQTGLENAHRFRVRLVSAIAVASALVNKLGILHFQTDRIIQWLMYQLEMSRDSGTNSNVHPLEASINAIGEFINDHYGETLVVPDRFKPKQPRMIPLLKPHNKLAIRYEIATQRVFIAEGIFRDWAVRKQLSPRMLIQLLKDHHVVIAAKRNLTLSAGTDIPGAQVLCIECDAQHPVMSGLVQAVVSLQQENQA